MSGETVQNVQEQPLLVIGEGSIDPYTRVANGEITETQINDFVERMGTDEFYDDIEEFKVPNKCVDGRPRKDGEVSLGADAAGGTFSVVMGDALTTNRYRLAGEKAPAHAKRLYKELVEDGHKIGVHDDDHATGENCGCGAEDKLDNSVEEMPSILRYMIRRGDDIRDLLGTLGIQVDDETHGLIIGNAESLAAEGYATNGKELRDAAIGEGGEEVVETLTGLHGEIVLGINTKSGTTLNRRKIQDALGDKFQAFNLDVAPLLEAAKLTSLNARESEQKFMAMLYYNVATAGVLAGPSLRIVAR